MQQCESTANGDCEQPATWRQLVHQGDRAGVAHTMYSYWCNEHAEGIVNWRRKEGLDPPVVERLSVTQADAAPGERRPRGRR